MPTSIYNNSLGYTISKEDDTFTITVNTGINNIAVALYREDSCKDNTYITIKEPEIITESITFKLPIIDGLYKLSIIIDENIYDYFFPYYGNLLKSIINDVELVLCDSESCKDCGDVSNKDLTSVLLKMMSYYILTMKYNSAFLNKSFECLECSLIDANQCLLMNEKILSKKENTELFNKVISTFYLGFYFAEKVHSANEDIDKKFKYNKIKSCIISKGISTDCIENNINNMATFSITSEQYINLPPSTVGNISINVLNRATTVLTLAHFTTSTTPAYSDPENDPADAVRIDSLPADGTLQYNNGSWVNVTLGQIISAADITAGKLRYVSPNQNASKTNTFNFSVRDTGSMQFKS